MINKILILVSIVAVAITLFVMYQKAKLKTVVVEEDDYSSIEKLLEEVKREMIEIVKEDYSLGLSKMEFSALYKRKARINDALKKCVYGIDDAKVIVIELIRGFIADNVPKERVTELLGLSDGMEPSNHVMFEIIMYRYKKELASQGKNDPEVKAWLKKEKKEGSEKDALAYWFYKNDFARDRVASDAKRDIDKSYYVTIEDLHNSYDAEQIYLDIEEQIDVLAVLVYQLYKGFGIVDTLREMDINGFNMGTSGSILTNVTKQKEGAFRANNAVWLYFKGKYIHLRFMDYGNEDELKRIIQLLIRYGNPGPLTAKRGYLVNTMYDKSRILALRPPASEYWAIFVRKFTLSNVTPEMLIIKEVTKRGDLAVRLIEYLIKGLVTCGVTGRQGSGKTTLMSAIVSYIDPRYTIRVLEMAPELYLRELYSTRNILSVQETPTVSAADLQDALKKSDAAVSLVGEVATDTVAARMIQLGQVASLFTIFSHHANTARDLVFALRNSLVNAGGFNNMTTAERQVTDVVKIDIHLDYTPEGLRYIERISEIVPLSENIPYPEYDEMNPETSKANIDREYYERQTDRVSFTTHDILRYDLKTNTYYAVNRPSPALEKYMRKNLGGLCEEFDKFIFAEWGKRTDLEVDEKDEIAEAMLAYYKDDERLQKVGNDYSVLAKEECNAKNGIQLSKDSDKDLLEIVKGEQAEKIDSYKPDVNVDKEEVEDALLMFDFFDGEVNI